MSLNVVFVGDHGVGKTAFLKRHLTGEFEKCYNQNQRTLGVKIHLIKLTTNKGLIPIKVVDTAAQENFRGLYDEYYAKADAVVIFFDVTSKISYANAKHWYYKISKKVNDSNIVICGNKSDLNKKVSNSDNNLFWHNTDMTYYDVSVKNNYNIEKPFLAIMKAKYGQDLILVPNPALTPPEVSLNKEMVEKYHKELKELNKISDAINYKKVMARVSCNGLLLKFINSKHQTPELCITAINQNWKAIQYVDDNIMKDHLNLQVSLKSNSWFGWFGN